MSVYKDPTPVMKILHVSPHFIVVNKPPDVVINTCYPHQYPITVETMLKQSHPELVDPTVVHSFRFCHRLDFSTSGVLCIALTKQSGRAAYHAFNSRRAQKYYVAVVEGHLKEDRLLIDCPIGNDSRDGHKHKMCTADKEYCASPRESLTKLLVLQRGVLNGQLATKVLLRPITGRRHQLRLHCEVVGHPVAGDFTYGGDRTLHRMLLHACRLILPTELEHIDASTPDPFTTATDESIVWQPDDGRENLVWPFEKMEDESVWKDLVLVNR